MEEQFIKAASNDEYAEFELKPDLVIITDCDGDGSFHPYIVNNGGYDKDTVVNLLYNKANFIRYRDLHEDNDGNFDIEHASIDSKQKA